MAASDSLSSNSAVVIEEGERELNLPSGYKFRPHDKEIVIDYLKRKILGQQLPADIIKTLVGLYSFNPDQIPLYEFKYWMQNEGYFFTTRPKGFLITPDGYWDSVSVDQNIVDGDEVIGFMQTLIFCRVNPPLERTKTWIVHEYKVSPHIFSTSEIDNSIRGKISNFVLCKVLRAEDNLDRVTPLTEIRAEALECPEVSITSSDSSNTDSAQEVHKIPSTDNEG